jgi:PAS domain S-box-containing protein
MSTPAAGREESEEDLFRLLIENLRDYVVFALDSEGRVLTWSSPAEHLLGYGEQGIVGQPAERLYVPEDIASGVPGDELRQALEAGWADAERWYVRKDGSRFWSGAVTTPLLGEDGALRGFARVMRDRTDVKRAEDARNDALAYVQSIVETVREPLAVLDGDLRVQSANRSFYRAFAVAPQETEGQLLYDLGNGQWDIPRLRTLLEEGLAPEPGVRRLPRHRAEGHAAECSQAPA